ncbi:MAG: hypothetical protein ACJAQT_002360 [Akkermansiaceae bacterium]|jgi:hypothetical protein
MKHRHETALLNLPNRLLVDSDTMKITDRAEKFILMMDVTIDFRTCSLVQQGVCFLFSFFELCMGGSDKQKPRSRKHLKLRN